MLQKHQLFKENPTFWLIEVVELLLKYVTLWTYSTTFVELF